MAEPERSEREEPDERERRRLYMLGALAQSYAPRGVADLLNVSPEGRAHAGQTGGS